MTVNVIDCELKQFQKALKHQRGHRTVYLDNIYRIGPLIKRIRQEIDIQKTLARHMNTDTHLPRKQLRHGAVSKVLLKSMEEAWQDLTDKLDKFDENLNTRKPVNWSEGEIKMFNGLVEILDQELQKNGVEPDHYVRDSIFLIRIWDGTRTTCRYPLPDRSVEWQDTDPEFDRINQLINQLNQQKPHKVF